MSREVFITGVGMVTPAGVGAPATWAGLLAGGRYVRSVADVDLTGCAIQFAGQVRGFCPPPGTQSLDRVCQMAVMAAEEAIQSAGIQQLPRDRTLVCVGTSKGGILSFAHVAPLLTDTRRPTVRESTLEKLSSALPDAPARCIARRFGITGGIHATVGACSTGTLSAIRGMRFIQDGQADLVICGSSDASLHRLWFAAFEQMGVLAAAHPDLGSEWACRPFDRHRAGFALGEGAGILVLESAASVRARRAVPFVRVAGAAMATDPAGLANLGLDGESLAWAIQTSLREANCQPGSIGCVQAHGTATPANDFVEASALRAALGAETAGTPLVSVKGAIGHLLGAAGAVELGIAAMICRHGISPGTTTLLEADCALGGMRLPQAMFRPASRCVLKTSLGFGGHVAAVVLTPE